MDTSAKIVHKKKQLLLLTESYAKYMRLNSKRKSQSNNVDDTLKFFYDKVDSEELKIVDSTDIVDYLCSSIDEEDVESFYGSKKTRRIRTAVVKCNLTDENSLLKSVSMKLDARGIAMIPVSPLSTSVHTVLEDLRSSVARVVIALKTVESMEGKVLDALLSLLTFHVTNADFSILICVSSPPSLLAEKCSDEQLDALSIRLFPLPEPAQQFSQLMTALLRQHSSHSPRPYLSGELLKLLRNRFLNFDYSFAELKKTIGLAVVQNANNEEEKNEKEKEVQMADEMLEYWKWFDVLVSLIAEAKQVPGQSATYDWIQLHIELQTEKNVWTEHRDILQLRSWLLNLNKEMLADRLEDIDQEGGGHEEELLMMAKRLRQAKGQEPKVPPPSTSNKTMTMTEFLKHRPRQCSISLSSEREALSRLFSLFSRKLHPWLSNRCLLQPPPAILTPRLDCTLSDGNTPLSNMYRTLTKMEHFKPMALSIWGAAMCPILSPGEFFSNLALLEDMGVVQEAPSKRDSDGGKMINLLARPTINIS